MKSTWHACYRPEFTANGIALKLLRDGFAFWCLIKTKIKKIMNFFTRTLASAKFATVNNYERNVSRLNKKLEIITKISNIFQKLS